MIAVRYSVQCVARASPGAGHPPHRPPPPARGARLPVAVPFTSFAPSEPPAVPVVHHEAKGERVIGLLTDLLEAQALTRRFEQLAGRTAMIAAAVALAVELAMPSSGGVFGWAASSDLAAQLAALGTFMLCCSVGLAARTTGRPAARRLLLEPVLASLTSQRRSLAGVTQRNVDRSLDLLMDTVFTPIFIRKHFPNDEDKYI
ncbi:hypothetical protein COHA_002792 [Chlorella ohadii]|uniref:Uncharacterized protein n=1 Tax=Chlorella ohadii TaxID=2649997 RepID=A0AAD5DT60_9CHLO|nr:hypothetical protein COHA_002792 [Chlorella ohadii]